MDDSISRQAAINAFEKRTHLDWKSLKILHPMFEVLEELPPAQQEPQWIPCSERLPEVDKCVLVTTEWNDISIAWRIGINKWFIHEGNTNATTDDLIAWMPLPEPYAERRRE